MSRAELEQADQLAVEPAVHPRKTDIVWVLGTASEPGHHAELASVPHGEFSFMGHIYEAQLGRFRDTGKTLQRAHRAFRRQSGQLVDLILDEADGASRIVGTPNHPFFIPSSGTFVNMRALPVRSLLLASTGDTIPVSQATSRPVPTTDVFNFEVESTHTYFVCSDETRCVLVHNDPTCVKAGEQAGETVAASVPAAAPPQYVAGQPLNRITPADTNAVQILNHAREKGVGVDLRLSANGKSA